MGEKVWELSNSFGIEVTYDDEYYDYLETLREQEMAKNATLQTPQDEVPKEKSD